MAVQFLLGRAGAGKTRACLDAIRSALADERDETSLVLLVPEQATFQMERALAMSLPERGYWRAEVLSFSRLARRILDSVGGEPEFLSPRGRRIGLRCVAARHPEAVRAFGAAGRSAGFFAQLERVIEELIAECVSAAALREHARVLADAPSRRRVEALATLYDGYEQWLGAGRFDAGRRMEVLRSRLADADWLRSARIWVDGFAGFTGQERETLVALAAAAAEVVITLLVDPHDLPRGASNDSAERTRLFSRTERTFAMLTRRFEEAGVAIAPPRVFDSEPPPRFRNAPQLARLEADLCREVADGSPPSPREPGAQEDEPRCVTLHECHSHREELRSAARFIRRKIIDSHGTLRFRDFAVIARDLKPLAPLVAEVFEEYGLPYFLDRRRPLGAHAVCRLIAALQEVVLRDYPGAGVRRLLRSGLTPLSRAACDALEDFIAEHNIHGERTWRSGVWTNRGASPIDLESARKTLVEAVAPLWALARLTEPVTGRRWTRALYETMSALHVPQRLAGWIDAARRAARHEAAETHQQVWSVVCDVLSDADAALAETPLSAAEFFDLLRAALAEESLGLTPPALDQVLVGSIERSRHPDIRYAWIVALNDGVFPATPSEDALLSTEERAALTAAGLPAPRSQRDDAFDERLLAYIALTRPSDGLVLSYALCDGRGAELAASPLVDWVRSTLPELKVDVADDTAPPVCMSEFVRGYLNARRAPAFAPERRRYAALRRRISSDVTIRRRLATALRGLHYANRTRAVPGYRRSNETPDRVLWFGSPSEMETYLQCPFKHYVRYGLRVRERPAPRPLHLELGEAAHQVLRAVFERAIDDQRRARDLTDEDWLGWLEEVRAAYEAGERSAVEDCRPEVTFLRGVLFERLRDLLRAHAERYRRGRFEPLAVEQEFGPNDAAWPPLEVRVEDERVLWMGGKIDRVDQAIVAGRRLLVVYDYKSSLGRVSVDYLTGDRLQLFLYARVLDSASDAKAGGALLAPLYPSLANADKWRDCDEPIQTMGLFLPRGRFVSDLADAFDEQAPDGGSAVVHMRRKNDGEFYQHSDACSADDFAALLRLAERTVAGGAAGIARGDVSVAPLLEGRTLACRQCAYREVCRYEPVMNAVRPAARSLPLLDECVEDDTGDAGGEGRA